MTTFGRSIPKAQVNVMPITISITSPMAADR